MSNVIIGRKNSPSSKTYHTDVCRSVWEIPNKRYWSKEKAEVWGYTECKYCANEFEYGAGDGMQTRRTLLNKQ